MRRPSHTYSFDARQLIAVLGLPLLPLAAFALLTHAGAALGLLPRPQPALDADRTILLHQAEASRQRHDADLLLIGDSSCLMDISAPQLRAQLPGAPSVLNLGTLSYLDPSAFARILREYLAANPKPLRTVVLLMHPEALRRPSPSAYHVETLLQYYAGRDLCDPAVSPIMCALGVETFRGRIWSRTVPEPLPGSFGRYYGFTHNLWKYLSDHAGSALDPGQFQLSRAEGNPEYRLAPSLEGTSRTFRAAVPRAVRFVIGITPIPKGWAPSKYDAVQRRLLEGWSRWIDPDSVLRQLPATMPDELFASTTHLNARGVAEYTAQVSAALAAEWRTPQPQPTTKPR
jgi:hypothetical protein